MLAAEPGLAVHLCLIHTTRCSNGNRVGHGRQVDIHREDCHMQSTVCENVPESAGQWTLFGFREDTLGVGSWGKGNDASSTACSVDSS
jgi:hypothetical protein